MSFFQKEVFAFSNIADELMSEMEANGAYRFFGPMEKDAALRRFPAP